MEAQDLDGPESFLQTPPASAHPQQSECDWAATPTTAQQLPTYPATWPVGQPCGLGLLAMEDSQPSRPAMSSYVQANNPMSNAYVWPSELLSASDPILADDHPLPLRSPPFQSLQAIQQPWNPAPAAPRFPVYQPTTISPQSAASYESNSTSPYSWPDGYVTAGSPMVKIESDLGRRHSADQIHPAVSHFSHPHLIDPSELSVAWEEHAEDGASAPSAAGTPRFIKREDADAETYDLRRRPSYRKAYSSDDIRRENRTKREYTKAEEANCSCDHCGKLFQRSYNLRVHLDTHQRHRVQAHACMYDGCNRRFGRRTDLIRHETSVSVADRDCAWLKLTFSRYI